MSVLIETSLGNIVIDVYVDTSAIQAYNFLNLCKVKYFQYAPVINVQKDVLMEIGDPRFPVSTEGSNIWKLLKISNLYSRRFPEKNLLGHSKVGTVSLVPDDRIVITLDENVTRLDGQAIVFGQVVEGFDALNKINLQPLDEDHLPLEDIRVLNTVILHDMHDNANIDKYIPRASPGFPPEILKYVRWPEIDQKLMLAVNKEQEAEAQALTLEMMGDLPSAGVKPLENILFVCKLNAITTEEDLKLIFSRFGNIEECDIVKDQATGRSLQYGFITFDTKSSCELAYNKMDGVIIDDRRIHVDFSQSVWNKRNPAKEVPGHLAKRKKTSL